MIRLSTAIIILLTISCTATKQVSKNYQQTLLDKDTFLLEEISTDKQYGLTPEFPVEVGGALNSQGPSNERRYLNALTGPNGEKISYYRAGSCCPVKSDNSLIGHGLVPLDDYRVTWEGSTDTVSIYINMYDSSKLKAPYGFGKKDNLKRSKL